MAELMQHSHFGFCWWDIPAAIILIGVLVVLIVRWHKLKKQKKELEDQLSGKDAENSMTK